MAIPDIQEALNRIEEGRPEEALPLLTTLAERMPTYGAVLTLMARAYEATGELDEARTAWQHAHFLMPNSPAVHEGLERVMSDTGPEQDTTTERLTLDPDLQAELDDELEALEQDADAFFTAPLEEMPMSLAEASLALVEQALSETDVDVDEPETTDESDAPATEPLGTTQEAPPDEDPYANEPFDIYEEIDTLIAQHGDALDDKEEAASADDPEAQTADAKAESEKQVAREEVVRQALTRAAEAAREEESPYEEHPAEKEPSDDLDRLIQELETARIVPDPDLDDAPEPELDDDIDDMVSETLARIYASQEKYLEAARAYERLAQMQPARADTFLERAEKMRTQASEAEDEAQPDDDD